MIAQMSRRTTEPSAQVDKTRLAAKKPLDQESEEERLINSDPKLAALKRSYENSEKAARVAEHMRMQHETLMYIIHSMDSNREYRYEYHYR